MEGLYQRQLKWMRQQWVWLLEPTMLSPAYPLYQL
jgi:hypothetical protein